MMRVVRYIAIFTFILFVFTKVTEGQECKDLQDWCTTLGASYCDRLEDMTTYCRKTCNACLPPACNECKHNCTVHDDGTHECTCLDGWELMGDKKSCEDIDECAEDIDKCEPEKTCRNFNGAFECMNDACTSFHRNSFIRSYSFEGQCCKRTGGKCGQNFQNILPGRIINGKTAKRGMWPWQALILIRRELCGGSLINLEWVVSAAHCFDSVSDIATKEYHVYLGVINMKQLAIPTSQSRIIAEVIKHGDYEFPKNDIALVRLNKPVVESDFVRPVCLPNGEIPAAGTKCFTTGFGVKEIGSTRPSTTLQQVDVPIVNGDVCKKAYEGVRDIKTDQMICAGYSKGGKDACQGDSGGPLVCQRCDSCDWYLVGVTSFGEGCATAGFYGVYANVENYEEWIDSKIDAVRVTKKQCKPTQWRNWGEWGACSKKCDTGTQSRTRLCSNGDPGLPGCLGNKIESKPCNTQTCGADSWTQWTVCSKTCGSGQQTRNRVCVTATCRKRTQTRDCNIQPCPSWKPWTRWGDCSKDCGGGERTRSRSCRNGEAGQRGCQGAKEQKQKCNTQRCVDAVGTWSTWSAFSECGVTCGNGVKVRTRTCQDGNNCPGRDVDEEACKSRPCPIWSRWSDWSPCSASCQGGKQTRTRTCGQGQEYDGLCPGESTETRGCGEGLCGAQCSELCIEYAKWGYCALAPEWMQNFCHLACCGPIVCKDTAAYCSNGQTWRCGEDQYRYDCTASCRYCT